MGQAKTLLVIWHSRTGASEQMARAAATPPNAKLLRARDVSAADLLDASGYLFVCPENLASMSGEMKEMFDSHYYAVLGKLEGRPYGSIIAAGSDGTGAQKQLDRIATGWRLRRICDPIIKNFSAQTSEEIIREKLVSSDDKEKCRELGLSISEGINLGVF